VPAVSKKSKDWKEKAKNPQNFLTPTTSKKSKFVKFGIRKPNLATLQQICKIGSQLKFWYVQNNNIETKNIFSVRSSPDPPIFKKIAVRSSPYLASIGFTPDPVRSSPDPCSSVVYGYGNFAILIQSKTFSSTPYPIHIQNRSLNCT